MESLRDPTPSVNRSLINILERVSDLRCVHLRSSRSKGALSCSAPRTVLHAASGWRMPAIRRSGQTPEIDGEAGAAPKPASFRSSNVMRFGSAALSGRALITSSPRERMLRSVALAHPSPHPCYDCLTETAGDCTSGPHARALFDRVIQTSGYTAPGPHARALFDRVIQTSGYTASGHHALEPESERHVTL
jgi:hypothetical protein